MSKEIGKATTAGPIPTCAPERFAGVVCPIQQAKVLIGAVNDTLSEAARQSNISQAWHILDGITATHVLVERMTRDRFASLFTGWMPREVCQVLGIIKPDPDPIAEYAANHSLDVDELRALVKGAVT